MATRARYKLVTVEWMQYFTYCVHCSKIYLDMRQFCMCGGQRRTTANNHRLLKVSGVAEPIAKFLVRFQEGRIVK